MSEPISTDTFWISRQLRESEPIARYFDFAERSYASALPEAAWEQYHHERLLDILDFVKQGSPYYREALAGIPSGDDLAGLVQRLPFTTKAILREHGQRVLSRPIDSGAVYYETTGTTAAPLPVPRSWLEMFFSNFHYSINLRHLLKTRFRARRPVVALVGPTDLHSLGDAVGDIMRNIDVSLAKLWPYSPKVGFRRATEVIAEIGVNTLLGTPAVFLPILRYAKENQSHYEVIRKQVDELLILGEITSPAGRRNLSTLYGGASADVVSYGGAELFTVASSCGHGVLHLARQNYLAEVIDPLTQRPVAPGQVGELVLTMLLPGTRPLIRYRTGDLVSLHPVSCPCCNPGPELRNHGRVSDVVELGGRAWLASEIEEAVLAEFHGYFGYELSIDNVRGRDTVSVRYEPLLADAPDAAALAERQQRMSDRLGVAVSLEVVSELAPAVNTGGFLTWKSARVVDHRQSADPERKAAEALARWLNGRESRRP